jgi:hypothetical protein
VIYCVEVNKYVLGIVSYCSYTVKHYSNFPCKKVWIRCSGAVCTYPGGLTEVQPQIGVRLLSELGDEYSWQA